MTERHVLGDGAAEPDLEIVWMRAKDEQVDAVSHRVILWASEVPLKSIRAWLGVDRPQKDEFAPLRETLEALDHLEPDRARYLGAFAYLLGRVAHADHRVSPEETSAMEALVREHGR